MAAIAVLQPMPKSKNSQFPEHFSLGTGLASVVAE